MVPSEQINFGIVALNDKIKSYPYLYCSIARCCELISVNIYRKNVNLGYDIIAQIYIGVQSYFSPYTVNQISEQKYDD